MNSLGNRKSESSLPRSIYFMGGNPSTKLRMQAIGRQAKLEVITITEQEWTNLPLQSEACAVIAVERECENNALAHVSLDFRRIPTIFLIRNYAFQGALEAMKAGAIDVAWDPDDLELLDSITFAIGISRDNNQRTEVFETLYSRYNLLSQREKQVLGFLYKGLQNSQIAHTLFISEATVKLHRRNLLSKMEANSLAHLIRMAIVLQVQTRTCISNEKNKLEICAGKPFHSVFINRCPEPSLSDLLSGYRLSNFTSMSKV